MGVYTRPDSPFFWLLLERPRQRPLRESTGIIVDGGSPDGHKAMRQLAQAAYAARMGDLARLRFRLPSNQARTFKAHREWYATHVTSTKRAIRSETSMLKTLGHFFDARDLRDIDQKLAREWRTVRRRTVSDATIFREEALLKHILTTAVPTFLDANPLAGLSRLRVPDTDTRILTPDEETRLLAALHTSEDRALILCALDTLLRLSNAKGLTRKQDHGAFLFSDTKTDAIRIPASTRLRAALDALPMAGAAFFPSYAPHTTHRVAKMFLAACARASIPTVRGDGGISFHCLRHTGASRMLAAGFDVKTVMRIGGWRNLTVLNRYLHPTDAVAQAAVNAIGGHASRTPPAGSGKKPRRSAG